MDEAKLDNTIIFPDWEIRLSEAGDAKLKEAMSKITSCRSLLAMFLQGSSLRQEAGSSSDLDFILIFSKISRETHEAVRSVFSAVPETDYFYSSIDEYNKYPPHSRFQFFLSKQIHGQTDVLGESPSKNDLTQVLKTYTFSLKDQLRSILFRDDLSDDEILDRLYSLLKRFDDCFSRVFDAIKTGSYPAQRTLISHHISADSEFLLTFLSDWQKLGKKPEVTEAMEAAFKMDAVLRSIIKEEL